MTITVTEIVQAEMLKSTDPLVVGRRLMDVATSLEQFRALDAEHQRIREEAARQQFRRWVASGDARRARGHFRV